MARHSNGLRWLPITWPKPTPLPGMAPAHPLSSHPLIGQITLDGAVLKNSYTPFGTKAIPTPEPFTPNPPIEANDE